MSRIQNLFQKTGQKAWLTMFAKVLYYPTEYVCMKIIEHFPVRVKKGRILFLCNGRMEGNARAVYECMISEKKNLQYDIVWLVDNPSAHRETTPVNVRFIKNRHNLSRCRTLKAYYYVRTAEKIMFTHDLNWVKNRSKEQLFLNLWHGCGYKAAKLKEEPIRFDYCLVPGEIFVKTKSEFFRCNPEKILPIGYPRYDMMLRENFGGKAFVNQWRKDENTKIIIWMPTFRKSYHVNLNEDSLDNLTDIPLLDTIEDIEELEVFCEKKNIVLLIKRHSLEKEYKIPVRSAHIIMIDDDYLEAEKVQLYEILQYTDALLSDYSSIAVDYLLLDKPIGFILQDYEEYRKRRGFVFENPLEYMPGNHIYHMRELQEFLEDIRNDIDRNKDARQRMRAIMHNAVSGSYSRNVLDYFNI